MNSISKLSIRALLVFALAAMAVAVSAQKEETTTDSETFTLPVLVEGEATEFSLEGSNGAILLTFNASEGDVVSIQMNSTSDLDPYLVLLNSDGSVLANDDDSGEEGFDSLIEDVELPADGTYFVLATSFFTRTSAFSDESEGEGQTFEILVEGINPPADIPEGSFTYTSVTVEPGDSGEIVFDGEETGILVSFTGEEGQNVVLDAVPGDGMVDPLLMLFDVTGLRVGVDDDGGDEPLASHLEGELPADGLYVGLLTTYTFDTVEGTVVFSFGD